MKISTYKIDSQLFDGSGAFEYNSLEDYLISCRYVNKFSLSGEQFNGFDVDVWIESDQRFKMEWQSEIEELVQKNNSVENLDRITYSQLFSNLGQKHNCVLAVSSIVESRNRIFYAIPFGHAYTDIEKICDPNFGIDVASRVLNHQTLNTTNVNIYFQSTLRQLTNYKKNTYVQSRSSESYDSLNGAPIDGYIALLGKTISCSKSVSVSKYNLEDYLKTMLPFFDTYESLEVSLEFPKVQKVPKSSDKTIAISEKFVSSIKNGENSLVSIIGYRIIPDGIRLIESEIKDVFIKGNKRETQREMNVDVPNINTIIDYIKSDKLGSKLADYMVSIVGEEESTSYSLMSIIQTEVELDGTNYVLSDGYWCEFNQSYLDKLDEYIKTIDVKLNKNLLMHDGPLSIKPHNKNITEDDYINQFRKSTNHSVVHKVMAKPLKEGTPFGNGIELCDVVIEGEAKTLVAIKKGLSTVTNAYSLEQSLLSLLLISNPKDFFMEQLENHLTAETIAIQWILPIGIDGEPYGDKRHTKSVQDTSFELTDLKSILLKNKLMEWHSKVKEINRNPVIYLDTPLEITD